MSSPTLQTSTTSTSGQGGASDGQLVALGNGHSLQRLSQFFLSGLPTNQVANMNPEKEGVKLYNQLKEKTPGTKFVDASGRMVQENDVKSKIVAMNEHLAYIPLGKLDTTDTTMFHAFKPDHEDIQYLPIEGDFNATIPCLAVQSVDVQEVYNTKSKKCEWNIKLPAGTHWDTYKQAEHCCLPDVLDSNQFVLMSATSCYGLYNSYSGHIHIVGQKKLMQTCFVIVRLPRTHEEMKEASKHIMSIVFDQTCIKECMDEKFLHFSIYQSEHLEMLKGLYNETSCKKVSCGLQITNGEMGTSATVDSFESGAQNSSIVKMVSLIQAHGFVTAASFAKDGRDAAQLIFGTDISHLALMQLGLASARSAPVTKGDFVCNLAQLYDSKSQFFKLSKFFNSNFFLKQVQEFELDAHRNVINNPFNPEKIVLKPDGWIYSPIFNMTKDGKNMDMFTISSQDPEAAGSKRKANHDLTDEQFNKLTTSLKMVKVLTDQLTIEKAAVLEQRLIKQQKDKEYVTQCELRTVFTMDKCAVTPDEFMTVFVHVKNQFKKDEISELFGEAQSIYSVVNVLFFTLLKFNSTVGNYGSLLFEKVQERVTYTVKAPKTEISKELVDATCKWYIAQVICVTAYTLLRLLPIPERNPDLECVGLCNLSYSDWMVLAREMVTESSGDFKKSMSKFVKKDEHPLYNFTPASVIHIAAYHQLYVECNCKEDAVEKQLAELSADELRCKAELYVQTIVTKLSIEKFSRSSELLSDEYFSHKVTSLEPIHRLDDTTS